MITGLCLKLIDKANSQKIRSFLEKVISSVVVVPAGDDVGDIGVVDISDDQQSDKWKQKRAVVVGVGSLS